MEFGGVLWFDASVRFQEDVVSDQYERIIRNGGWFAFFQTKFWAFIQMHPNVFYFFPTNIDEQRHRLAFAGSVFMLHLTEDIYWSIAHWYFTCPLDPRCMPTALHRRLKVTPSQLCGGEMSFLNLRSGAVTRSQCHGYEQPVLNALVSNYFGYNQSEYYSESLYKKVLLVREPSSGDGLQYCRKI